MSKREEVISDSKKLHEIVGKEVQIVGNGRKDLLCHSVVFKS